MNSGGQDTNGNLANNLGARPKIRRNVTNDQVVPNEIHTEQEDNDEASDDDFYVYRYTGNGFHGAYDEEDPLEAADLPKSFYQLDVGSDSEAGSSLPRSLGGVSGAGQSNLSTEVAALIQSEMASASRRRLEQRPNGQQNGRESPDMDFLEMDFDPGEDSNSTSEDEEENHQIQRPQELKLEVNVEPVSAPLQSPANLAALEGGACVGGGANMTRSRSLNLNNQLDQPQPRNKRRHSGEDGLCTASSSSSASAASNMELCGARLSQREALVFGLVPGVHRAMLKLRMLEATEAIEDNELLVDKTMIWSELEACKRQVNQIGVSACGATALINVLQALEISYDLEIVTNTVPTRLRAESAPIPEYLFSRSTAGTCHQDLIDSMTQLTSGQVTGRFFSFYPPRKVSLLHWLASWLNQGAIPVATLNLQRGLLAGQVTPDAWHHQMIFGVSPDGVFLTNPLESVSVNVISEQLCSESELLVRRTDIISRWHPTCDLQSLTNVEQDERWDNLNVLGQVVDVLREEHQRPLTQSPQAPPSSPVLATPQIQRTHVRIPAVYQSGITLFVNKFSNPEGHQALISSPELALKN